MDDVGVVVSKPSGEFLQEVSFHVRVGLLNESDAPHDSECFLLFCGLSFQFGFGVWTKGRELKRLRIDRDCPGIDFSGLQGLLGLLVVMRATTQGTE